MQEIYSPREDSFFFSNFLKKELPKMLKKNTKKQDIKFLDMGCGSCILSTTAKECKIKNIACIDINQKAVNLAKQKGFLALHSDLFRETKEKYDIICFNAPYLPKEPNEPKQSQINTTGGKRGDEISLKFLKQAKTHLNKNGKIFLLISSLTPTNKIKKYNPKIRAKKKIFFEELKILEFDLQKQQS